MFVIGIICGGPSQERGISLNSARTLLDHLGLPPQAIRVYFVNGHEQFYHIDSNNLYSNTPADFNFKLKEIATHIPKENLKNELARCNLIFPVIHGSFGEDGRLQAMLENYKIPFIGSSSAACQQAFLKNHAQAKLKALGYPVIPHLAVTAQTTTASLLAFWRLHSTHGVVIKPNNAGSSIDVHKIKHKETFLTTITTLLNTYNALQVQPFCKHREITIVVLTQSDQSPVALLPTETILQAEGMEIFDYRSKYLPTNACQQVTPANLPETLLASCRNTAEKIFTDFQLRDFARLDGWVCPQQGFICYDINIVSGFEENSFLFKQASYCGLSHKQTIHKIIKNTCTRYSIDPPTQAVSSTQNKVPVYILSGGASSERQVSLMSGRNVWFKLNNQTNLKPQPFFLDKKHQVWQLPYNMFLHHTVEEITRDIQDYNINSDTQQQLQSIYRRLDITPPDTQHPTQVSWEQWIQQVKKEQAFVFLGLHGGIGENGTLQKILHEHQIPFNGSGHKTSGICMNKHTTVSKVQALQHPSISTQAQTIISMETLVEIHQSAKISTQIKNCIQENKFSIIKPISDGCSAGIVCIHSIESLVRYAEIISTGQSIAPPHTFYNQPNPIEMPVDCSDFLLESYIKIDQLCIAHEKIQHQQVHGWFELTIGVREKDNCYHAFNPSITVSTSAILSLEEKFQGGTGINLTPPPEQLISSKDCAHIKNLACLIAKQVSIQQYARLDIFYNTVTKKLQLIEVNTLPALSPSTVLFQQALAESPPISPKKLLSQLVIERMRVPESVY